MKVIETTYNGVRFRSRLEARWAVFFDRIGIRWDYEPEAFLLSDGLAYLPDFRLFAPTGGGSWLEIKPEGGLSEEGLRKIQGFTKALNGREYPLLARGAPWSCELFCCEESGPSGLVSPPWYFMCRFSPDPLPSDDEVSRAVDAARAHRFWNPGGVRS